MNAERWTIQKQVILDELRRAASHPTADELYERVRERLPNISLGTVYRNLDKMAAAGEIDKVHAAGAARRFDGSTDPHVHVQCTVCGKIADVSGSVCIPDLNELLQDAESPFEVDGLVILLQGKCPECAGRTGRLGGTGDEA